MRSALQQRFAIASTEKGGTGADYPQRIVAMHHLDLSWTPASLVQRRGRGHRQGNLWSEVHEFVYGTAGANGSPGFDAYKLGLVKIKSELNYKFMTGDVQERHCEDVGEDASHYMIAAAILSGNNTALEHARITRRIRQLSSDLSSLSSKLEEDLVNQKSLPGEIEKLRAMLADALSDVEHLRSLPLEQELEQWIVGGVKYSKTKTAAKALMQAIYRIVQGNVPCFESKIGSVASLGIYANYLKGDWVQSVYLRSQNGSVYYDLSQHWETGTQLVRAIGHAIASIARGATVEQLTEELERQEAEFNELPQRIENLTSEVSRLHQELEPLIVREAELKKLLMEGQKDNVLSTSGASSKRVAAPSPASYRGADPEVIEYIKSLPVPTTTDAEGKLISWIDAIAEAALKVREALNEVREGEGAVKRQMTRTGAEQLPRIPLGIPSKSIVGEQLALF